MDSFMGTHRPATSLQGIKSIQECRCVFKSKDALKMQHESI